MNTGVTANELIEIYKKGDTISVDTNGQKLMSADDCFVLASRLIDQGMYLEHPCPLQPFGKQLVVRIIHETNRQSSGGVHLLDTDSPVVMEPALRGVVLAVGPVIGAHPEAFIDPPKVGDLVLFSRHAGIETVVGDKRYLTMEINYALTKIVFDAQENPSEGP